MPQPWQDTSLSAQDRAAALLSSMTLEEKLAQLSSVWPGSEAEEGEDVAPLQHEVSEAVDLDDLLPHGIGQLTRPFGTAPVEPAEGAAALARLQARIAAGNRFGIPALAHEECLTGFCSWRATVFPTPLAWGASFDPALVGRAAELIGGSLRSAGVHQGLAPVLDVVRDARWGRTEESIGEDPYLVATIGTAYVRGLESTGIVATLKHFAGYAASRGARNHAPASIGPRELADVVLPPFEMAVRDGGARSVMHSYNDIDGVPSAANPWLLTELLRDTWGFTGTVVADYFGISFLELAHRVADTRGGAAGLALAAGVDVELPAVRCFGIPLRDAIRAGEVDESLVDRATLRVLRQKCELGLLDPDWSPTPPALAEDAGPVDLDPPEMRAVARELAEESVVLLADDGDVLPLAPDARIAVVGPLADDPTAMLGCYTFPRHVGVEHPELPLGIEVPTLFAALRAELPGARITHAEGCAAPGPAASAGDAGGAGGAGGAVSAGAAALTAESRLAQAARTAADADVCVAVLGDRSGLFGRGTSGEGCDAADLELPGEQGALLDTLVATGTPVVLVLFTGRPYALGRWSGLLAAAVQTFFPGEEGGPAVAGVLSGRVNPSGRLPVSVPYAPGGQPWTYAQPPLGLRNDASSIDPTPLFPFGHGLSYTSFAWERPEADATDVPTDGETTVRLTVRNTGDRAGTEVVQLYLHDPVARIARPESRLIGYVRVPLRPGESAEVHFTFHADLASYPLGADGTRVVEPGALELRLASSSADSAVRHTVPLRLTGPERTVDHRRRLVCEARLK
ncbi:glycoside hydrolase family 3 N-terminal domain-containing protein [Streptomyces luomodiensis]|uniref:Glycoside hydrolase family 3 N-terminal domain-containing protein n=1 Tax=Streptomyces luomodiensis TaxID=3026192 RepID=A0ABY9UV32_9ACTN|nr:glycoside hydrolase family 3 N-terminal domain-containing protein [Streptomyces sp. SCA4-21]WNE96425.1 glycoside hydrolase family 3 N-terminal domain-containing protein [Streptomyces sp. SCA4-21]